MGSYAGVGWVWEEFRVSVSETTLSRILRALAIASSRPAPAIMPRPRERSTLLKSVPRAPGRDRARQGDRSRPDRGLVRGRGPDRAEEQDYSALGTTRHAAPAPHDQRTASTYIFGAICPGGGRGAAPALPACNTEAMNLHLAEIATEVAPGKHAVLVLDQAGWHLSARLAVPDNVTLIVLPSKCPRRREVLPVKHSFGCTLLEGKCGDEAAFHRVNWAAPRFRLVQSERSPPCTRPCCLRFMAS